MCIETLVEQVVCLKRLRTAALREFGTVMFVKA